MKEIEDLERSVWELIKRSTETKDLKMLARLNPIAQDIDRIKKEIDKIKQTINSIEGGEKDEVDEIKMVSWEITKGAIEYDYLSITKPKKARLIPADGTEFEIETSEGQVFRTEIIQPGRLRERGEIKKFYKMANIKPGDKVVWQEIIPFKRYRLSKE